MNFELPILCSYRRDGPISDESLPYPICDGGMQEPVVSSEDAALATESADSLRTAPQIRNVTLSTGPDQIHAKIHPKHISTGGR